MDLIRRPLHPRVQRRRDLAHSLGFPAELRERFSKLTGGELAALKIIASEVVRHGACTLTKNAIADRSIVSHSVVMTALRTAKAEGLIAVERTGRRNTITLSPTWMAWLDRHADAPPDGPRW
jgi:DNA-binding PadR family transcriptional regulator